MRGSLRIIIAFVLVPVILSAALLGQADKAILYPDRDVRLNGNALQTSSAVLSGDKIQTGGANAQMTGQGLTALVYPNSSVQYGDVLLLSCGGVLVNSGLHAVQASDTRIAPVGGTAKFEVLNRDGKLTVNVQSGTVRVSSDQVTTLAAGQSTERASSDGCPVAAGITPVASAHSGAGKWIVVGGAAAGGGLGIYLAERNSVSPSKP